MTKRPATDKAVSAQIDIREALYNDNPIGLASVIQIPAERITRLDAIVVDADPALLLPGNPAFPPDPDPRRFLTNIRPALDRHPLARHAEVRSSGSGLHLILRLDPAFEMKTSADQKRCDIVVRVVQRSLPSDPQAPSITALTRPIGSINSKNGALVELLEPGRPISPEQVVAFVNETAASPFRALARPWLGSDRVVPCPACLAPGSSLGVLDRKGECYHCGGFGLEGLFSLVYREVDQQGTAEAPVKKPGRSKSHPATPSRGGHPRKT